MVRAPGVPKTPRAPKAAAPPRPTAPAEPVVAPETAPPAPVETVAPVAEPAPQPIIAMHPQTPAPLEPVPTPAYFHVAENITPSTKRHPGATMQYAAGRFYVADEFLTELWRDGDPCIKPYEPKAGE